MRGKHWVDGVYRPFLIDHAASLKSGFDIRMTSNDAFRNLGLSSYRARTIDHLRNSKKSVVINV